MLDTSVAAANNWSGKYVPYPESIEE